MIFIFFIARRIQVFLAFKFYHEKNSSTMASFNSTVHAVFITFNITTNA
jgi:hypothetical protein